MSKAKESCVVVFLAAAMLVLGISVGEAALIGYATDDSNKLYEVDLGSATATEIGPLGVFRVEGLALSSAGHLFGTDAVGNLHSINTATGAATLIGSTGRGDIEGLDFLGDTLLGSDPGIASPTAVVVFSIDTSDASTADVVTATSALGYRRSMTVSDANTVLMRVDDPTSSDNTLASMDLTTGDITIIGDLGLPIWSPTGLDFAPDGMLYGLCSDGTVVRIDPTDASSVVMGDTGDQLWLSLAISPVPEPAGLGLIGLAMLAVRRKTRR